jgi:hypothetical protein
VSIEVTLGEPLWRDVGARRLTFAVSPEGLSLEELLHRIEAGSSDKVAEGRQESLPRPGDPEAESGYVVIVNGRVVPAAELGSLRFADGDVVSLQILLSGG